MVDFRPFQGISYNAQVSGPLGSVICPPYDVISELAEKDLLQRSLFNMVRLELTGTSEPPSQQKYLDAASTFRSWRRQGVLVKDEEPSYYLLGQQFRFGEMALTRYNLFGVLHLEDFGANVLPHEATKANAKADRLALIEACAANFSPILGLHNDPDRYVNSICNQVSKTSPAQEFTDEDGRTQRLWRISNLNDIRIIQETLASTQVYIADGHHRYETALTYSKQATLSARSDIPASHFVMVSLTSFDDTGLLILPYHRIVRGMDPQTHREFSNRLHQVFRHTLVPPDKRSPDDLDSLLETSTSGKPVFGLVTETGKPPSLLSLSDHPEVQHLLSSEENSILSSVDPWILDKLLFRPVFGDSTGTYVEPVSDSKDAYGLTGTGEAQFSFILNGIPSGTFKAVLDAGLLLPAKSTYFYPKLPSGLLIHSLEGNLPEAGAPKN